GSAASGAGLGVGVRGCEAAWFPLAGVMRNRSRYWRSHLPPQNHPTVARKTPPAARNSSSVAPGMVVRQPVQCCPTGSSTGLATRERIHFITTCSSVSPLLDDNDESSRALSTRESPLSRRLHPPGPSRPLSSTQGEWVNRQRLFPGWFAVRHAGR